MNFKEDSAKVAIAVAESLILTLTPDDVIKGMDKLVHTAVDKNMTGEQKFNWVINEARDFLPRILKPILVFIAQALYDGMVEAAKTDAKQ